MSNIGQRLLHFAESVIVNQQYISIEQIKVCYSPETDSILRIPCTDFESRDVQNEESRKRVGQDVECESIPKVPRHLGKGDLISNATQTDEVQSIDAENVSIRKEGILSSPTMEPSREVFKCSSSNDFDVLSPQQSQQSFIYDQLSPPKSPVRSSACVSQLQFPPDTPSIPSTLASLTPTPKTITFGQDTAAATSSESRKGTGPEVPAVAKPSPLATPVAPNFSQPVSRSTVDKADPLLLSRWPAGIWDRIYLPQSLPPPQQIYQNRNGFIVYWCRHVFRIEDNLALGAALHLGKLNNIPILVMMICSQETVSDARELLVEASKKISTPSTASNSSYSSARAPSLMSPRKSVAGRSFGRKSMLLLNTAASFRAALLKKHIPTVGITCPDYGVVDAVVSMYALMKSFGGIFALFTDDSAHPTQDAICAAVRSRVVDVPLIAVDSCSIVLPRLMQDLRVPADAEAGETPPSVEIDVLSADSLKTGCWPSLAHSCPAAVDNSDFIRRFYSVFGLIGNGDVDLWQLPMSVQLLPEVQVQSESILPNILSSPDFRSGRLQAVDWHMLQQAQELYANSNRTQINPLLGRSASTVTPAKLLSRLAAHSSPAKSDDAMPVLRNALLDTMSVFHKIVEINDQGIDCNSYGQVEWSEFAQGNGAAAVIDAFSRGLVSPLALKRLQRSNNRLWERDISARVIEIEYARFQCFRAKLLSTPSPEPSKSSGDKVGSAAVPFREQRSVPWLDLLSARDMEDLDALACASPTEASIVYPADIRRGSTKDTLFNAIQLHLVLRGVTPRGYACLYWLGYLMCSLVSPEVGLKAAMTELATHSVDSSEDSPCLIPLLLHYASMFILPWLKTAKDGEPKVKCDILRSLIEAVVGEINVLRFAYSTKV